MRPIALPWLKQPRPGVLHVVTPAAEASAAMSAFGTKRTFGARPSMSAFGGKADIS
jgi:hypothetical protein